MNSGTMLRKRMLKIPKEEIKNGLHRVLKDYTVAALTKKGEKILYDYIDQEDQIIMDYTPTVLSPKKFFFPQDEVILEYNEEGKISPRNEIKPTVLFGIRPCDINGTKIMDEVFAESNGDPNYLAKREKAVVIGVDCLKPCDEDAFCYLVNAHYAPLGCDLMLHELGNDYLVSIVTEKGEEFTEKYLAVEEADQELFKEFQKMKDKGFENLKPMKNLGNLADIFEANKNHPIWQEEGEKCLSCGSCVMVCPTCYCFDVADEIDLSLKKGKWVRRWDACMLNSFAEVAGGENFRGEVENRLRHRINRKFNFLMRKHSQPVCVGCGRCGRACLVDISPGKIAKALAGERKEGHESMSTTLDLKEKNDALYIPEKARIIKVEQLTSREKSFQLELVSGRSLDHVPCQFVEVSVLGIGEAPISIASPPSDDVKFELCVRAIGDVTNKLNSLTENDTVMIRGPFGHGFDAEIEQKMAGKHLLLIAGGLGYAPLRSLIIKTTNEKEKYKKISILYGSKSPEDRLYQDELDELAKMGGKVELLETVDQPTDDWKGSQGVITTLIPKVDLDPDETIAVIIGPPVMYKFVLTSLLERKIPNENIYMSLERRMKCGVGKCGHCQMDGLYVCQEGPVFNYTDVERKVEVL